jgi:hypothetical protein
MKRMTALRCEAFQHHLVATHQSGVGECRQHGYPAYVNHLTRAEKRDVLSWTRAALGRDVPFGGPAAFIENETGDPVDLYLPRDGRDRKCRRGFPSCCQTGAAPAGEVTTAERARVYQLASQDYPQVLAFELEARGSHPMGVCSTRRCSDGCSIFLTITGMKHSLARPHAGDGAFAAP